MKKTVIRLAVVIALITVALLGFRLWRQRRAATAAGKVDTIAVRRDTLLATVSTTGNVAPTESRDLSFASSGVLAQVNVEEGAAVLAGQELARLDTRQLQLSIDQAVANLTISQARLAQTKAGAEAADVAAAEAAVVSAQASYESAKSRLGLQDRELVVAESDLKRAELALQDAQAAYDRVAWLPQISMLPQSQALEKATLDYQRATANYQLQVANINDTAFKGTASQLAQAKAQLEKLRRAPTPEDLAIAEAQVQQAQVSVDQARLRLEDAILAAPFAGTVLSIGPQVGEMVSVNAPVIVLADLQRYYLEATVDETDVGRVQAGQEATITSDSLPGLELRGKVTRVDLLGKLSQGVVSYGLRIDLLTPSPLLRPKMTAIADITVARKENVLGVPNRAIRRDSRGRYYVEVASEGAIAERTVTIGVSNDQFTEVVTGLDEGEEVVASSANRSLIDQFGSSGFSLGRSGQ